MKGNIDEKIVDSVHEIIEEVVTFSGGFTDQELVEICIDRIDEKYAEQDIIDIDYVQSLIGLGGTDDSAFIMVPIDERKDQNPPKRKIHEITKEKLDEILSDYELVNISEQERLVKYEINELEEKDPEFKCIYENKDEDPFQSLIEEKIYNLVTDRREKIEKWIKDKKKKQKLLNVNK